MKRFFRKVPLNLLFVLPVLFYFALAVYWHARDIYVITGDEPNYLLISDSIVRDFDLKVENNYQLETTPVQRAIRMKLYVPGMMHVHLFNQYSRHNIGLPLLLAIPYLIGGIIGSKIFMAALAGLWPLLFYRVLFQITESKTWSLIVAITLGISLPFFAASNQIYPDLVGGMIIFVVMTKVFGELSGKRKGSFSLRNDLWVGLLIGFLPWLHLRFAAPAIVLLLAYTYTAASSLGLRTRSFLRTSLRVAAIITGSFILLSIYNRIAFGNPFGPYENGSLSFEPKEVAMTFLGLHWDQGQGMFIQQPLLLLGLVGIVPLIKANWRAATLLALAYLSVILPNAMHRVWYGGFSFYGRFGWSGVALWVFPLAFTLKLLLEKRMVLFLKLLCGLSLLLQIWYASKWIPINGFLFNQQSSVWSARSFYENTDLLLWLPTFRDFDTYLINPANILFVFAGFLLVITGWLLERGHNRLLARIWTATAFASVLMLILVPIPKSSLTFAAISLPSKIGTTENISRVATEKDGTGALMFGPFIKLLPGLYEARLEYSASGESTSPVPAGKIDVVYSPGLKLVGEAWLPPTDSKDGVFIYRFPVRDSQSFSADFEFRVWYLGQGSLKVHTLTLTPISFDQ